MGWMNKIQSLRGTTPAEIFNSGLENIGDIRAVALSVLRADGSIASAMNSPTSTS